MSRKAHYLFTTILVKKDIQNCHKSHSDIFLSLFLPKKITEELIYVESHGLKTKNISFLSEKRSKRYFDHQTPENKYLFFGKRYKKDMSVHIARMYFFDFIILKSEKG